MNLRYLYLIKQTIAHNQQGFNSLLAKWELQVIYSNTQEKCYLLWNVCPNLSSNNMLNQYILSYQIILLLFSMFSFELYSFNNFICSVLCHIYYFFVCFPPLIVYRFSYFGISTSKLNEKCCLGNYLKKKSYLNFRGR